MSTLQNDPLGQAIIEFASTGKSEDIIVKSDICDDDIIPSSYLLRTFQDMPEIEKIALNRCIGKVLDVGAGAGIHASYLMNKGLYVEAIDVSQNAVKHMVKSGIQARNENFFDLDGTEKFDTLLLLMNGIGIAGELNNLSRTLLQAKNNLTKNGKIICDSTDVKYLYEDDEGGMWVDVANEYYGNFNFQMVYKNHQTEWFKWLYVDFEKLKIEAEKLGFTAKKVIEIDNHYLAELTLS